MAAPWQELGDRVFRRKYDDLRFNVGAVLGAEGVLIVDSRASEKQGREIVEDLRKVTDLPVRWVVNTHYHWDHAWGNMVFRDCPIWGHEACRTVMLTVDQAEIDRWAAEFPAYADDFKGLEIVPPDQVFTDSATIDLGGRSVTLQYFGLGHTNSDIAIHVPDANVLFAGDLLEEGAPPWYGDSFPLEWPETAEQLLPLATGNVVPGHGETVDRWAVERQVLEIGQVAQLIRQVKSGAMSRESAVKLSPYPDDVFDLAMTRADAKP
jgi:glyoxylase-like metal-dependent hydrolase (beta-lactamase superfamily II)